MRSTFFAVSFAVWTLLICPSRLLAKPPVKPIDQREEIYLDEHEYFLKPDKDDRKIFSVRKDGKKVEVHLDNMFVRTKPVDPDKPLDMTLYQSERKAYLAIDHPGIKDEKVDLIWKQPFYLSVASDKPIALFNLPSLQKDSQNQPFNFNPGRTVIVSMGTAEVHTSVYEFLRLAADDKSKTVAFNINLVSAPNKNDKKNYVYVTTKVFEMFSGAIVHYDLGYGVMNSGVLDFIDKNSPKRASIAKIEAKNYKNGPYRIDWDMEKVVKDRLAPLLALLKIQPDKKDLKAWTEDIAEQKKLLGIPAKIPITPGNWKTKPDLEDLGHETPEMPLSVPYEKMLPKHYVLPNRAIQYQKY